MPSLSEELKSYTAVVITGGSSGIGKSFINLTSNLNGDLFFCNLSRGNPAIKNLGKRLNHFACDMSRAEEVARAVTGVEDFLRREVPAGRVLLINNSGFGSYGPFPEPNLPQQLEMMDLNMRALVQLTGLMLPLLRERGGAVINVASTAAFQPTAYMATYGATKTFVLHWSLALNEELRGTGVRMLAVCPGATSTGFFQRAGMQPGNALEQSGMSCDTVVTMALRALAAGRSQVVTGWKNKLMAFAGSLPPKPFAARVAAKLVARFRLKKGSQ